MSRLRVVHVGVGLWGRSWAELIAGAPGYRLVAVADESVPGRAWAEQELLVPSFRDLGRAVRETGADVVVLASPPATHRPLAELALAEGCHVVVEKPLAPTLDAAAAIAAAAARAGRHAMVSQNYRFRRQSRGLRELVRGRALGSLLGIRISCRRDLRNAWISRRDWRGRMPHPYLLDMAIHHVDMLRMIMGAEVADVDARSWGAPDGPFKHDPTVEALLTLDDGTPVSYEGTWAEPLSETSWNGDWELVGSRARATWSGGVGDALRGTVRLGRHREPLRPTPLPVLRAVDRLGVLAELRRALAAGEQPECSAADNLRSLAAIFALARSTEERRPVQVEELLAG
jgi:predicted dehydrogenase